MPYFTKMNHLKLYILTLCLGLFIGCSDGKKEQAVTVMFTCDTQGRLEPCGCFSGQYGGLARIATRADYFTDGTVIKVDAGNSVPDNKDYNLIMYKYVQEAFKKIGYDAVNVGAHELTLSLDQLKNINQNNCPPIISANLVNKQTQERIFKDHVQFERDGLKIAIVGVVDPTIPGETLGEGLAVKDMPSSITESLKGTQEADFRVLLAYCSKEKMHELAKKFFEFDLIIGGAVQQPSQKLERINRSYVLYTTNKAKNVGHVSGLFKSGNGLSDVDYDIPLLFEQVPEKKEILDLADAYRKEIRNTKLDCDIHNKDQEDLVPGVTSQASYVGSQTCASCHSNAHKIWQGTAHAHAFATLEKKNSDADPRCIKCHTVGFGEPSGYKREFKNTKLVNVSCESCHGPGSEHVKQRMSPEKVLFKYRPLGEGDCRQCHHGEFSRPFDWKKMWPKIKHGKESQK